MNEIQEKVKAWIDGGCNFDEGVMLLSRYSNHRALLKNLQRGEPSQEKLDHLSYHLSQLAEMPEMVQNEAITINVPKPAFVPQMNKKDYPEHIVVLKKEKEAMIKDRAIKQKGFMTIGTNNDALSITNRKVIADEINALTEAINAKDDEIRLAFEALKPAAHAAELPANTTEKVEKAAGISAEDVLKLKQTLDNLVASLSKDKGKAKTAQGPKLAAINQRIATKTAEIEKLRKQLAIA